MTYASDTNTRFHDSFEEDAVSAGMTRLKMAEQLVPQAEDNTNGVIAVLHKPTATSQYVGSLFAQFASGITSNVKSTSGCLLGFQARVNTTSSRYVQFHNTATVPASAATPVYSFLCPGTTSQQSGVITYGSEFFGTNGKYFATGIAYGDSLTEGTYTLSNVAAGDMSIMVHYI